MALGPISQQGLQPLPSWPLSVLSNWLSFFQFISELWQKAAWGKHPAMETDPTPASSGYCPGPSKPLAVIDPIVAIHDLTFTVHHCPTFSLYKPGSILSTLEIVFEMWVCSLPCAGLTALNPFLASLALSLCLWILSVMRKHTWAVWDRWSQGLLHICGPGTSLPRVNIQSYDHCVISVSK